MIRSALTIVGLIVLPVCALPSGSLDREIAAAPGAAVETLTAWQDHPAVHNMLVVGEKTVFLSHLPMFQRPGGPLQPHRYQAILEVALVANGTNAGLEYAQDRQAHPTTRVYTLSPEVFVLPDLSPKDTQTDPIRRFKGDVFRGHLEKLQDEKLFKKDKQKGEGAILTGIDVRIVRIVHLREFDPRADKPPILEYLLFGKGQELFLAHLITRAPDFDQVVKIDLPDVQFTDEELAKGVRLSFPGTTNSPATRLKAMQEAQGESGMDGAQPSKKVRVKIGTEFYFEEGELQLPANFSQTPEENKAGMPAPPRGGD